MDKYTDRQAAGQLLAKELKDYANRKDVMVLALPRGGVPVAFEIAKTLHLPLDVFIVRKLGVPGHRELAMGAIATGGSQVFNPHIIKSMNVSQEEIQTVIHKEQQELKRREAAYRGNATHPSLQDKTIILVDDGIATGATLRAAILALKHMHAAVIVVAVPVAEKKLCETMQTLVDRFICPLRPTDFYAVGAWYDDFSQTEDEEVRALLEQARHFSTHA